MIGIILEYLKALNNSKFFAGVALLMLNIGSKYISFGFSENQEGYLKHGLARQMLIFSIAWIGSKDLVTSIVLILACSNSVNLEEFLSDIVSNLILTSDSLLKSS